MSIEFGDRMYLTPENVEAIAARLRELFADKNNIACVELHERLLYDPILSKGLKVVPPGITVKRLSETHCQILLCFNRGVYDLSTLSQTLLEFHPKMLIVHHAAASEDRLTWIFTSQG